VNVASFVLCGLSYRRQNRYPRPAEPLGWLTSQFASGTSWLAAETKIYCKAAAFRCDNGPAMTYLLPALNPLRAFEAAARHLSLKLAAHELHVTPGAVSQQVKTLEDRLGLPLFDRLHKQLGLTPAAQDYLVAVRHALRSIADATARLRPNGVATVVSVGVHPRFELGRARFDRFRAAHPAIGLRILQPAGLHELVEGKIDALVLRSVGHPGYRCDRLAAGSEVGDCLICPEGTARLPRDCELARLAPRRRSTNGRFPCITTSRRPDRIARSAGIREVAQLLVARDSARSELQAGFSAPAVLAHPKVCLLASSNCRLWHETDSPAQIAEVCY
jgi:LysR family transcriptional regulator, glycine cleavage system transcriptional activator